MSAAAILKTWKCVFVVISRCGKFALTGTVHRRILTAAARLARPNRRPGTAWAYPGPLVVLAWSGLKMQETLCFLGKIHAKWRSGLLASWHSFLKYTSVMHVAG